MQLLKVGYGLKNFINETLSQKKKKTRYGLEIIFEILKLQLEGFYLYDLLLCYT